MFLLNFSCFGCATFLDDAPPPKATVVSSVLDRTAAECCKHFGLPPAALVTVRCWESCMEQHPRGIRRKTAGSDEVASKPSHPLTRRVRKLVVKYLLM